MGVKTFMFIILILINRLMLIKKNQYQESCVLFFPRHDIKDSDPDNIKIKAKS